ncbi:MAG: hypothetical protein JRJ03_00375 [Deltaproteobacteria bacterium]|nr:hypothetical protein [Deltaproteobacteria bacterium]
MKAFKVNMILIGLVIGGLASGSAAQGKRLPEFYGTYISQGDKLIPLKQGNLKFRTGIKIADIRSGLYGIPEPPDIRIDPGPFEIIHFNPEISPSKVRLSYLIYLTAASANFFDIKKPKTNPAFFRNVYGVRYNQRIPINLWVVDHNIPLSIAPVPGKPGMYRLVPRKTLQEGIYAVNFGSVGGPRYYIGNLKFYPFVLGTAQWLEGMKKTGQNQPGQRSSMRGASSSPKIDILPGCAPKRSR